jgi:hypothetical protein
MTPRQWKRGKPMAPKQKAKVRLTARDWAFIHIWQPAILASLRELELPKSARLVPGRIMRGDGGDRL